MKICRDVIVLAQGEDRWVAYNVRSRTALGLDALGIDALAKVNAGTYAGDVAVPVWKIGLFSNSEGLLADPTRFIQRIEEWPESETVAFAAFVELLSSLCILIDDEAAYRARFAPKKSLLDYKHFGNFHQQLGQHLMLKHRRDPADWWISQKFSEPGRALRDNLYGAVQGSYLKDYFAKTISPGMTVLDVGCGPGYFSNMMASHGAEVLGVDPSEEYLAIARTNAVANARFECAPVSAPGGLAHLPEKHFDFIFMSDALLFYFVAEAPDQEANIDILLSDIRRLLKDDGVFVSVEPHYLFWLAPWLGSEDNPFTVFAEYNDQPGMRVTPTLSRLIGPFTKNGFAITGMEEFPVEPEFAKVDRRAHGFANRFPLWQLYELRKH
jgi:SAM-dependent methyltransferase